jgi:Txe/YoeB family toxin of Txe-Axe toxin-antitoxin module
MKCQIYFADEQVREAFQALQASQDPGERRLAELLVRALGRIAADAFCGIQVPKKLIPKDYHKKHGPLKNLWKYNLSRSWRLMYTVASDGDTIAVIIEWLDHTDYDRRFGY